MFKNGSISESIVFYILQNFGLTDDSLDPALFLNMSSGKFYPLDGIIHNTSIKELGVASGYKANIDKLTFKLIDMVTYLDKDTESFQYLLVQLGDLSKFCIGYNLQSDETFGVFSYEEFGWVEMTPLILSQFLSGIERIKELMVKFIPCELNEIKVFEKDIEKVIELYEPVE